MNKALFITAASLLWTTSIPAQDVDWKLDKNHSRVGFVARHLAFAKVRGQFQKFTAKVRADVKTGKLSSSQEFWLDALAAISYELGLRDGSLLANVFLTGSTFRAVITCLSVL